jgi:hypothetical protein
MKSKLDLPHALVLVSLLPRNLNRRPRRRLRRVEQIHAHARQMPILQRQPMLPSGQHTGPHDKFHPNDPLATAQLAPLGKVGRRKLQFGAATIHPQVQVAPQRFGVRASFFARDHAISVPIDHGQHPLGHFHPRRQVHVQPHLIRRDAHQRRLEIFIEPMGERGRRHRDQRDCGAGFQPAPAEKAC